MVRRKRKSSCLGSQTGIPSSHQSPSSALTPAEKLSRADDLMSDVLDSCLWPTSLSALSKRTIKFTSAYRRPRALNMNDIKQIIYSVQTGKLKNISEATALIRQLPAVVSYMANAEPPRLGKHMGLYLQLFLPKCGIRFCETDRYDQRRSSSGGSTTSDQQRPASDCGGANLALGEAQRTGGKRRKQQPRFQSRELRDLLSSSDLSRCSSSTTLASGCSEDMYLGVNSRIHLAVFATRDYVPHDLVAGCEGSFADLTEQENLKLRSAAHLPVCAAREPASGDDTDFSHIVNSRGKFQVFCGPARFVNHDCSNNVELLREGFTIKFKVIRPIKAGEEILTSYGANYFGERNCECMCATCERTGRGFYSAEPAGAPHMKRESEEPSARPEPGTDTDLSSLLDSSEASPMGDSPVSAHANTPPQVRRHLGASLALLLQKPAAETHQPASRSSSTRRQQSRTQEEPSAMQPTYVSRVKFVPTTDLTLPLLAPSRDASVAAIAPPQPQGAGVQPAEPAEPLPVKRKTYWITTKQKQLGLVPWEPESGNAYAPVAPSLLGPCKRRSTGSPASGAPSAAAPANRAPRLPMRSYWISTKQKQLGIVPWEPAPPAEPASKPPSPASTRATRAARKAAAGVKACPLPPTAPKGRRLSFRVFDEGTEEAVLLTTPIGRELFGFRPRGRKSRDSGAVNLEVNGAGKAVGDAKRTDENEVAVKSENDQLESLNGTKESQCQQEEEIDMLEDELSSYSGSRNDEPVVTDKVGQEDGPVVSKCQAWTGLEWPNGKPGGGGTGGGGGPSGTASGAAGSGAGGAGSSSVIEVAESSRRILVSSVG